MYGCYGENFHVIHLWELKGKRKIVSSTKEKPLAVVPFCLFFPIGKNEQSQQHSCATQTTSL